MFAGAVIGVVGLSRKTVLVVRARLLLVAAILFAVFFAGAFRVVVFAAFFVVLLTPPRFFAASLADFRVVFLTAFFADFFAAMLRGRAFAALFFLEPLPAALRAPFAFLLPFFVAIFPVPLLWFRWNVHTVANYFCDVHASVKRNSVLTDRATES